MQIQQAAKYNRMRDTEPRDDERAVCFWVCLIHPLFKYPLVQMCSQSPETLSSTPHLRKHAAVDAVLNASTWQGIQTRIYWLALAPKSQLSDTAFWTAGSITCRLRDAAA